MTKRDTAQRHTNTAWVLVTEDGRYGAVKHRHQYETNKLHEAQLFASRKCANAYRRRVWWRAHRNYITARVVLEVKRESEDA